MHTHKQKNKDIESIFKKLGDSDFISGFLDLEEIEQGSLLEKILGGKLNDLEIKNSWFGLKKQVIVISSQEDYKKIGYVLCHTIMRAALLPIKILKSMKSAVTEDKGKNCLELNSEHKRESVKNITPLLFLESLALYDLSIRLLLPQIIIKAIPEFSKSDTQKANDLFIEGLNEATPFFLSIIFHYMNGKTKTTNKSLTLKEQEKKLNNFLNIFFEMLQLRMSRYTHIMENPTKGGNPISVAGFNNRIHTGENIEFDYIISMMTHLGFSVIRHNHESEIAPKLDLNGAYILNFVNSTLLSTALLETTKNILAEIEKTSISFLKEYAIIKKT